MSPHPNRGKQKGIERVGGSINKKESAAVEEATVGCQVFNNRKCGNKKKCLQTQEDTWQEKTGAKPRQGKFCSFKLGESRENDPCERDNAGCHWSRRWLSTKKPKEKSVVGKVGMGFHGQRAMNESMSLDRNFKVTLETIKKLQSHP